MCEASNPDGVAGFFNIRHGKNTVLSTVFFKRTKSLKSYEESSFFDIHLNLDSISCRSEQ